MAKKLIAIYIEIEQIERLHKLSAKTGVYKSEYIREAFDLVLKKYEKQLMGRRKKRRATITKDGAKILISPSPLLRRQGAMKERRLG